MKSILKLVAFATILTFTVGAFAQPGPGGGGGGRGFGGQRFGGRGGGLGRLLQRKDVQSDLKLTDDQIAKIKTIADKEREESQAARDNANASGDRQAAGEAMRKISETYKPQYNAILTPEQQSRIKQIQLQLSKSMALTEPDTQNDLGLTSDQKSKIKDLQEKFQAAMQQLFQKVQGGELDMEQARPIMQKNAATFGDELAKILTPEQQAKWKEMQGAPFVATEQPRQGRGGGGGR